LERILAPVERLGVSSREAFLQVAGPFPVAAPTRWTDDWHARRCIPDPHLHEGLDIFASLGAPVVATTTGG
jgi:hypothetical protein